MKSFWGQTIYIIVICSLGYFATDIYLPSLPAIGKDLRAGEAEVQMTLAAYLLSFSLTPLIFGPLSDHFGRKKVILSGLLLSLLATIACLFASSINALICFRFFQGVGAGAVVIAGRATIPDLFEGMALARQYSYMTTGMPLILALAPLVGGYLQEHIHWRAVFVFLTAYVVVIFLTAIWSIESLKSPKRRSFVEALSVYRGLLGNRGFVLLGLSCVVPNIAMFGYLTASPFLFQGLLGLSPSEFGFLAVYVSAMIIGASSINTRLLRRFPIGGLIRFGHALILSAGLLLVLFHLFGIFTKWSLLGPVLLFFSCMPFVMANCAAAAMGQIKEHFGSASAILASLQFLFGTLGSVIFATIPETDGLPLGLVLVITSIVTTVLFSLAPAIGTSRE